MNNRNDSEQELIITKENKQLAERNDANEIKEFEDPPQVSEIGNMERKTTIKDTRHTKQRSNILNALQTFVVGSIALIGIGSATVFPPENKVLANIGEIKSFDTYAEYSVESTQTEDQELILVIFNDYFKYETTLEKSGETVGVVDGLRPDEKYTMAVMGNFGFGEKTLSKKTFRTVLPENALRPKFEGIELSCTCGLDNKFNFKLKYEDKNGCWSEFSAVLFNENETMQVAECVFLPDTAGWQYFDVSGLSNGKYLLIVKVLSSDYKDSANPIITLYRGIIEI